MNALAVRIKELRERIDALSLRERGLIFFGFMVVLYLVAYNVVFGPLRVEQRRLEQELKTKQEQIRVADQQVTSLFADGNDINSENRSKAQALRQQIKEFDARMDQMTAGVVTPKEMARLMEQMLQRSKSLQLVKLEALAPMAIDGEAQTSASTSEVVPTSHITVYRHGMRVELRGRYFEIVEYLKALEGLPWKVFWGEVSLESDKYPISKVSLVIYTLSRHSSWIGV